MILSFHESQEAKVFSSGVFLLICGVLELWDAKEVRNMVFFRRLGAINSEIS